MKNFNRIIRKSVLIYIAFAAMLSLVGIGFFVWVIIKVMEYLGII